jgi:hypothetical protein
VSYTSCCSTDLEYPAKAHVLKAGPQPMVGKWWTFRRWDLLGGVRSLLVWPWNSIEPQVLSISLCLLYSIGGASSILCSHQDVLCCSDPKHQSQMPWTNTSETMSQIIFTPFKNSFIHMCIHCLGHFSPMVPTPTISFPSPPCFQAETVLPLSLILLKRRHKHKKDKAFLLVELRIAIQRDS